MNDIQEYCRKIYGDTYSELIGNEPEAFAQKEAIRAALTETMREFPDADADTIARKISNAPRDISWLKEQVHSGVFDLYAVVRIDDGRKFCYGCIQSKTSIRDRVTRDREPSLQAMRLSTKYWLSQRQWFNESWRADIS